jgi:large subunit ribosomal protein L19
MSPVNIEARKSLDLRSGDTVRVHQKIEEKGKTRIQVFEGLVLARKHGTEAGATFTVRRSTGGYGVEKIYPLYSPMIDKIEIVKRSKVRRGKLYYIRRKAIKQISKRMKMMFVDISDDVKEEEKPVAEDAAVNENEVVAEGEVVATEANDEAEVEVETPATASEEQVAEKTGEAETDAADVETETPEEEKKEA